MVPKPGGVRKGWRHMWVSVCDGFMTLHERSTTNAKKTKATGWPAPDEAVQTTVFQIFDLR